MNPNPLPSTVLERLGDMEVHAVPILESNISYLIVHTPTSDAMAVDPADPVKLLNYAKSIGAKVLKVLTTHHHHDHDGGNSHIAKSVSGVEIVGGEGEGVSSCTTTVKHGDIINFHTLQVKALHTKCHTANHMSFYLRDRENTPALFSGDTLFIGVHALIIINISNI
eukprot:GHVR01181379.1.p1 GENE.GHVR01181379.1~~GHVR01181379.1.p1  ORF type:complete len:167 (-),score=31.70 GHVR01181379.1:19-519(-)